MLINGYLGDDITMRNYVRVEEKKHFRFSTQRGAVGSDKFLGQGSKSDDFVSLVESKFFDWWLPWMYT
jgi:hypothetical protein